RDLKFQLDDQSGKTIITVYDGSTEEVVRQIPDDVVLRLARDLQQDQPISLFNAKV
ncbi:flagellar protein FlaG, partial [Oleiphilus sp. HI0079]|uniref:flagellar protein FlaG n=2 Tax=Oleiphilus TaxID=141450 RepID=UPI000B1F15B9